MFERVEAFYRPESAAEVLRLLLKTKGGGRVVAGGTDLAVAGGESVRFLIDLSRAGLSYIRRRSTGCVIGATTTLAELEESKLIHGLANGLLARAAATCGSVQIRNTATLGGNLANASPAADMVTPLLALDAKVVQAGRRGRHILPLADYLAAAGPNGGKNSLLIEVVIPEPPRGGRYGWSFQKFGRTEVDISVVNVAAGLQLDARRRVKWASIALGAVAPVTIRARGVEELLLGHVLDQALLAAAGAEVMREVRPISDVRAPAEFRRELSKVLIGRALEDCAAQVGCPL